MKRIVFSCFILFVMVFLLVACGGNDTPDSTPLVTTKPLTTAVTTTISLEEEYTKELSFLPIGDGSAYAVSCGNAKLLSSIVVPAKYLGKPVKSIAEEGFKGCSALEEIYLPSSITNIGEKAFYECSNLENINFPESITRIGAYAFYGCTSVESIYIPKAVKEIGKQCFFGCASLKTIVYNAKNCANFETDDKVFCGYGYKVLPKNECKIIIGSSVRRVPNWCFSFIDGGNYFACGYNVTQVVFEEGCTAIGQFALIGLGYCTEISFPKSLTTIEERAFQCDYWLPSEIKKITIPQNVSTIQSYAFYNWNNLEQIVFNGSVAKWNSIQKGDKIFNTTEMPCKYVQCRDGKVFIE